MGARPYVIHVKPSSVLGWISDKIKGAETLVQVRILENVSVPDGDFGCKVIEQVRVLTPGAWQVYQKSTQGTQDWVLTS